MRARITLAFVAILAVALLLAGAVSLLLVRAAARRSAEATVLRQAEALVAAASRLPTVSNPTSASAFAALLPLLHSITGLSNPVVLVLQPSGRFVGAPPPGLPSGLDTVALAAGHPVAGTVGTTAWAAAPLVREPRSLGGSTIALYLASAINFSSSSVSYFLVAGGISLLVAAGLAVAISARISRRVVAAAGAAERIAGGDLAARVPGEGRDYPELRALRSSINTMAAHLERARRAERQFLLSVSHDLRTPLTSIRGYAEAIAEGAATDAAGAAAVIVTEARRLERLIGDLLDLARLDASTFSLDLVPLDLAETVASAAEALRYEFDAAGVALDVDVPELALGVADEDRLRQVVANLLENALKFARARVTVTLARAPGDEVVLRVVDDGPGIAAEDLPHVFERHFSSSRYPARAAGSGLGLTIVAELTAAMGGTIEVTSPLGPAGGTAIAVTLPGCEPARR
ncbi:MAG TPA: HAMP domain-containing sensor histidine kinase [Acidimicrobiales bacterium]|nr:HAMP domain-containing sensor histidine kinase [Acidimicrobiales bacterium]